MPNKRQRVLSMFGGKCAYCGDVPDGVLGIDHVIPRSKGGGNSESNLLPCCRICNSVKGVKSLEEFILYMDYIDLVRVYGFSIKQLNFLVNETRFADDIPRAGYFPYFMRRQDCK